MAKKKYKWVGKTSMILASVGAINWGLIELFSFNVVDFLSFGIGALASVVYYLVALSGLYGLYWALKK